MPQYSYEGFNVEGLVKGQLTARSKAAALEELHRQGVNEPKISKFRPFSSGDFWRFFDLLRVLLLQNIRLTEAIEIISKQKDRKQRDIARSLMIKLGEGQVFNKIIEQLFRGIDQKTLTLLEIGTLNAGLKHAIGLIQEEREFKRINNRELIKALSYPTFVLFFSLIALIVIFDKVLPEFKQLLNTADLTQLQKVIFWASGRGYDGFLYFFWFIIFSLVIVVFVASRKALLLRIAEFSNVLPGLSRLLNAVSQRQYLHALSLTLQLKMDISEGSQLASSYVSNPSHRDRLNKAYETLLEGKNFTYALSETKIFNEVQLAQIEIAERSNRLTEVIFELDRAMIEDKIHRMNLISQIVGPLAILILGVIIFLVAFVVISPIMLLQNSIG